VASKATSTPPIIYVLAVIAVLAAGVWGYLQYLAQHTASEIALTPEAKAYVGNLRLSDVELKANETYLGQTVVEIAGKIGNGGNRPLGAVEVYCLFSDRYGQLVLRRRLAIVSQRMGGLKPGETKLFRLAFDDLPESWNQAMPKLAIAAVRFS
jgi:hypothetical protein